MILFMCLVVWFGFQFAEFGWDKETMATQIPRGIPYAAIPIGAAVFVIHCLLFLRRFVRGEFEIEDPEHEAVIRATASPERPG
jgi:TRAP-type C4-dicarboxylate transport system permease small subunit